VGNLQIAVQLYLLASFALDALATAAQGLVSAAAGPRDVTAARAAANRTLQLALVCGGVIGMGLGLLDGRIGEVTCVPKCMIVDVLNSSLIDDVMALIYIFVSSHHSIHPERYAKLETRN
jgi:Na+-driven multidrug efflux pump